MTTSCRWVADQRVIGKVALSASPDRRATAVKPRGGPARVELVDQNIYHLRRRLSQPTLYWQRQEHSVYKRANPSNSCCQEIRKQNILGIAGYIYPYALSMVTDHVLFLGAENPCAQTARTAVRTSGSAMVVAVERRGEYVVCEWIPRSPASHHQVPHEVNPDASLCLAVRGRAWSARHGCGEHVCCVDNADRRRAVWCGATLRRTLAHSRWCRDRSKEQISTWTRHRAHR